MKISNIVSHLYQCRHIVHLTSKRVSLGGSNGSIGMFTETVSWIDVLFKQSSSFELLRFSYRANSLLSHLSVSAVAWL